MLFRSGMSAAASSAGMTAARSRVTEYGDPLANPNASFSLGFWLGDEGSGGYLGKTLVVKYMQEELPDDLSEKFSKKFQLTRIDLLGNAYKKPFPNRYFAGFSKFLFDNRNHPVAYQIIYEAFSVFLEKYVCKHPDYQKYKVHFTGSVAFYYNDILRRAAAEKGLTVRNILETPIAGLTLYHQQT